MNLRLFIAAGLVTASLASCDEKGPTINFGAVARDTFYMAPVESQSARKVLIEEFTGVTCPNCPAGHTLLASLESTNPDRFVTLGYHVFGQEQAKPKEGASKQDFRTQKGTEIGQSVLGGMVGIPVAGFDRVTPAGGSSLLVPRPSWSGAADARKILTAPANITIKSVYEGDNSHRASITVRVAYTQVQTKSQLLSVAITEGNIIDAQEYTGYIDTFYTHKHVLRDYLTNFSGDPMFGGGRAQAGAVYERTFVYTVNTAWKAENCKVVAFIHSGEANDREVFQAQEADLK